MWFEDYFKLILTTALLVGVNNLFGKTYAYKIPLTKVIAVERNKKELRLKFYNEADEPVEAKLRNVQEADYKILAKSAESLRA